MSQVKAAIVSLCLLLISAGTGWAVSPAPSKPPVESTEDEERERLERMAPPGGAREGALADLPIAIVVNGAKKAAFTGSDLDKLQSITTFTPRGDKKSWAVVDVLKNYGVDAGKTVNFYNKKNKKISLSWEELLREKEKVTFTYNFKGELIVSTDVADRVPEEVRSTDPRDAKTEDQRREQMHKQRQRSLIFFRDVRRVEVVQ